MVLSALKAPTSKEDLAEIYTSTAFGLQIIIEILIENKIAHNVMVSDSGLTVYIFLRVRRVINLLLETITLILKSPLDETCLDWIIWSSYVQK